MSEDSKNCQLIVSQASASNPKLEALAKYLKEKFDLDPYTVRIRLSGSGKALFGSGSRRKTTELANVLREYGYDSWLIQRSEVLFSPLRLRELKIAPDIVHLIAGDTIIDVNRSARIVAVLADISGALEERTLKMHAVQSQYKQAKHVNTLNQEKLIESVFKGKPVLDIYLIDSGCQPQFAVRVYPARYDAKGLGDRMTMSATRNLQAIIELLKEYADHFSLHVDFGISRLPNCQIKNLDGQFLNEDEVLKSLTRFGWLMCDLEQDQGESGEFPEETAGLLSAAAIASGRPELVASIASASVVKDPALLNAVDEIRSVVSDADDVVEEPKDDAWLPQPPEKTSSQVSGIMMLTIVGVAALVVASALISRGDSSILKTVLNYSVKAGVLPGLFSLGLFWAGFHFVRLKRRVENTPTSRIRSMAMGMVEVSGKTVRKYALVSPVNQTACVYYRLRKYKRDNRNKWVLKSDKDSCHVPFLLDDGTGQVTIDPKGATVRAKTSRTGMPGEATLAFHGVSTDSSNEKWVENIIFEGTPLYVLGYARPLKEDRKSLRERTVEKLRDLKLDRKALHRYDTDGDGQISEDEWQVARSDAEQLAMKEHLSENTSLRKQEDHAFIAKPPERGLPFVIAEADDEAHLIRNYGLFSIPLFITSSILAVFALVTFLKFAGVLGG